MSNVKVKTTEGRAAEESKEILADAIIRIGQATAKLVSSGINKRAIIVLLNDLTGAPLKTIKQVLDALPQLEAAYCVDKRKAK